MSNTTGAIEAYSNDDNRFGLKVDGDWYNGFGDLPEKYQEKGRVVEIEYETNKNNGNTYRNVDDVEDDLKLVEDDEEGDDSDSSASQHASDRQENMSRQKPIEAVGRIYQGNPPTSAQELNEMKVLLKELTNWSNNGEFAVDAQLFETDKEEIQESLNGLSERIGQIEQKLASQDDEPPVKDMSEVKEFIEEQLEQMQDDDDMDVLFDEDDDEPEEESNVDEFVDNGARKESKVDDEEDDDDEQ